MFKKLFTSMIMVFLAVFAAPVVHGDDYLQGTLEAYKYKPSDNVLAEVDATLAAAKSEGKLAMIVLGAAWCHDSRGFSGKLSMPAMQQVVAENYKVLFIDVAYLEKGKGIVERFGLPAYYGTPTVMIISPEDEQLLNRDTLGKWTSADSFDLTEYVSYFGNENTFANLEAKITDPEQASKIKAFEEEQAVRLFRAYAFVGPLLKAYKNDDSNEAKAKFIKAWEEVRDFRMKLNADVVALRRAAAASQSLAFPSYPKGSWE